MKRKIIEDSINYLKFVQKNKKVDIQKENLTYMDFDLPEVEVGPDNISSKKNKIEENILIKDNENTPTIYIDDDWIHTETLESLEEKINNCNCCNLHTTRKNFVFGTGNKNADVMLIGEAPGADEDIQGKPFVGRAGKLLTDILKAINFERDDVYICNILKCRPPDNRNPNPDEIEKCEPYLFKQIEIIKPRLILCLGTFAGQSMLKIKEPLGKMRGKFYDFKYKEIQAKLMVTYHPAALLRNPNWKRPTWEDVQLFRKEYEKEISK